MLFSLSSKIARAIACRRALPINRLMSTQVHPYKIHVGTSFAGKPVEYRVKTRRRKVVEFPPDSDIVRWREETLSIPKAFPSKDAGEDFFYVQQV